MDAGTIIAKLKLNAEEFKAGINDAKSSLQTLQDDAKKVGTAMVGTGIAMATGIGMAVKTTADFQSGMSRVGALSGATDEDLKKLTKTAENLGATTAFSAIQASEGMSYLAMAGYEVEEIISAMPGVLDMAAAGQVGLGDAANIASNIMSGFGLEASKAGQVADVLTKTFTSSNTSLHSLGESFKYVAPVASAVGWSMEDMASAIGLLGDAGIDGSMAGTALRTSITKLASPAKEAYEMMEELGLKITDANGVMLPLDVILQNLNKSMEGMTDTQKANVASTIFGTEAMSAMLTLMKDPSAIRNFSNELDNAGGSAQTIAEKQLDNLNGRLTLLKSAWEGVQIVIGNVFIPILERLTDKITGVLDWFNNLDEGTQKLIVTILGIVTALLLVGGGFLLFLGFLPKIIGFGKSIWGSMQLVGKAFSFLTTNPIALLVIAIMALIGIFIYLWNTNEEFRAKVIEIWNKIKEGLLAIWDYIVPYLKEIWDGLVAVAMSIFEFLKQFWDAWGSTIILYFKTLWGYVSAVFSGAWEAIKGVVKGALDIILGIFNIFVGIFTGDWDRVWKGVGDIFKGLWSIIVGVFKGVWTTFTGVFTTFKNFFTNIWGNLWGGIKTTFGNVIGDIIRRFTDFPASIMRSLDKLVSGVKDKVQKAKEWLGELNPFKRHSPSLVDNVLAGVDIIKDTYKSVSDMEIGPPSIGGLTPGRVNVGGIIGEGATGGSGGDTNYNSPLVHVDKMEVRDDSDIRAISSELYNLQRNAERKRGR